jgi:hypothetical protein
MNAEASRQRLQLASKAGALVAAVDAAETIKPRNSLERMAAHQLAALHNAVRGCPGERLVMDLYAPIGRVANVVSNRGERVAVSRDDDD